MKLASMELHVDANRIWGFTERLGRRVIEIDMRPTGREFEPLKTFPRLFVKALPEADRAEAVDDGVGDAVPRRYQHGHGPGAEQPVDPPRRGRAMDRPGWGPGPDKRGDRGRRRTVGRIERGGGDGGEPVRSPLGRPP